MQPAHLNKQPYDIQCFSTLYGSKWVATGRRFGLVVLLPAVSVPSTGRSGLQRLHPNSARTPSWVSVPSTGRSGLQRQLRGREMSYFPCFSTLYGSKWVATTTHSAEVLGGTSFSTLYGSKWVATRAVSILARFSYKFQYPLRVEVGCNGRC